MEIELAARHEAGHAVVMWMMGMPPTLLEMRVVDSNATDPVSKPSPPSPTNESEIRKNLCIYLAGNAATWKDWPGRFNNEKDWQYIRHDMQGFYGDRCGFSWIPGGDWTTKDPVLSDLLEQAKSHTSAIVEDDQIRPAIDRVAEAFRSQTPDSDGIVRLAGDVVNSVCGECIGETYRTENPWSDWLAAVPH